MFYASFGEEWTTGENSGSTNKCSKLWVLNKACLCRFFWCPFILEMRMPFPLGQVSHDGFTACCRGETWRKSQRGRLLLSAIFSNAFSSEHSPRHSTWHQRCYVAGQCVLNPVISHQALTESWQLNPDLRSRATRLYSSISLLLGA